MKSDAIFWVSVAKETYHSPEHLHCCTPLLPTESNFLGTEFYTALHSLIKATETGIHFLSFLPEITNPKYFRGNSTRIEES